MKSLLLALPMNCFRLRFEQVTLDGLARLKILYTMNLKATPKKYSGYKRIYT